MERAPLKIFTTVDPPLAPGLRHTLAQVKLLVSKYCGLSEAEAQDWLDGKLSTSDIAARKQRRIEEIAQHTCFAVTQSIGTPYLWGMSQQMCVPGFKPLEAVKWVYDDYYSNMTAIAKNNSMPVRVTIDVDYFSQNSYKGLHRAGW